MRARSQRDMNRRQFVGVLGALGVELVEHRSRAQDAMNTSSANLKAIGLQVGSILEQHIATGYMPGAVALIARGPRAELVTVGKMAQEGPDPMRRDSIFRIASMTKPITAAAALIFVEGGRLHLDEPIDRWLPELAHRRVLRHIGASLNETVPARRPITLQDLLTLRCGLGMPVTPDDSPIERQISQLKLIGFGGPDPAYPLGPEEWLKRLATLPLMAQPGEQWLYNTGSYILGVLLARVSGLPLAEVLRRLVFEPLGMQDTGFVVPEAKRSRLTSSYRLEAGRLQLSDAPAGSAWNSPPDFPDGAAGLVSTADDYFIFVNMLLGKGRGSGPRLLSERSIIAMTSDTLTAQQRAAGAGILGEGRGWGLGLSVVQGKNAAGLTAGTYGWNGGWGSTWVSDPVSGLSAIVLTPTMFSSPEPPAVHQEVWRAVLAPSFL